MKQTPTTAATVKVPGEWLAFLVVFVGLCQLTGCKSVTAPQSLVMATTPSIVNLETAAGYGRFVVNASVTSSTSRLFVDRCGTAVQKSEGAGWVTVDAPICAGVLPPWEVLAGQTVEVPVTVQDSPARRILFGQRAAISPGVYRLMFSVSYRAAVDGSTTRSKAWTVTSNSFQLTER